MRRGIGRSYAQLSALMTTCTTRALPPGPRRATDWVALIGAWRDEPVAASASGVLTGSLSFLATRSRPQDRAPPNDGAEALPHPCVCTYGVVTGGTHTTDTSCRTRTGRAGADPWSCRRVEERCQEPTSTPRSADLR